MAAIELFNRTRYSDKVLYNAALRAKRIMKVKGDVAVLVRYHAHSTGYLGMMHPSTPFFRDLGGKLKKFANRAYMVKRKDYDPHAPEAYADANVRVATKDAAYGWIEVRVPKPRKSNDRFDAVSAMNTMIHEMRHIWQYRNKEEALAISGSPSWDHYIGFSGGRRYKRVAHQSRPIEKDVNNAIAAVMPKLKVDPLYNGVIEELAAEFSNEKLVAKAKSTGPKYNKYGDKMSDYRNVKMKTLRSGDKIVTCACGEKAVILPHDQHDETPIYTHIASVDEEAMRFSMYSASECRTTQYGHIVRDGKVAGTITWGYRQRDDEEVSEDVFKSYKRGAYRW